MIFPVNRKIVGCLLLWMKNDTFLEVILWFASDKALTTTFSTMLQDLYNPVGRLKYIRLSYDE
jgi:hypothetical protein